jgi:hypothetical protein
MPFVRSTSRPDGDAARNTPTSNQGRFLRCSRLAATVVVGSVLLVGLSAGVVGAAAKVPEIIVTASPNPVVETSTSNVAVIIQVEANSHFGGDTVTVSSTEFESQCAGAPFYETADVGDPGGISLTLDNDGNATVYVTAQDCAPGKVLIEASLDTLPYSSATTRLVIESPKVTAPGLHAYPDPEVEVGDGDPTSSNAASEASFVFYVEANPVYAEGTVSIVSDELTARCGEFSAWFDTDDDLLATNAGVAPSTGLVATEVGGIDDDGNAVFVFDGGSCAAGRSSVTADVTGGPSSVTTAVILPPAVTV